ncbi:MAG: hypothetical protein WC575_04275 [Patescibacteria group bacterium]
MNKIKIAYLLVVIITIFSPLSTCWSQTNFNPQYIISDQDLFDYNSLNLGQIQKFLEDKGSALTNYKDPITSMLAADIIHRAAQEYQINPKYLLTLLQKEQSLIENGSPLNKNYDWAAGYGICDDCSMNDPLLLKFKGFFNQVIWAAKVIRTKYVVEIQNNGKTFTGFGPGITKTVDGLAITPANKATAILYTYTPHLKGNELLWNVWNRYFSRSYPDGSLLNIEGQKEVWLIQNNLRRKFASKAVYLSYYQNFDRVLTVSDSELKKYPSGNDIKFPAYSFLRSPRGTVYLLLTNDTIRGFDSQKALRQIGINPEEIVDVSFEDLAQYSEGAPITVASSYPQGTLIQDKQSGGVYFVQDSVKHPIFSREILKSNFGSLRISERMTSEGLLIFTTGEPILFKEGDLLRSTDDPAVYVISDKYKRPIYSALAFEKLGYDWDNIIVTNVASLGLHQLGEPVLEPF